MGWGGCKQYRFLLFLVVAAGGGREGVHTCRARKHIREMEIDSVFGVGGGTFFEYMWEEKGWKTLSKMGCCRKEKERENAITSEGWCYGQCANENQGGRFRKNDD